MVNLAGMSLTSKNTIDSVRDKLKQELVESIDMELEQNFVLFYNKLDIQEENIKVLEKQKELIVGALSGADKIRDPVGFTYSNCQFSLIDVTGSTGNVERHGAYSFIIEHLL